MEFLLSLAFLVFWLGPIILIIVLFTRTTTLSRRVARLESLLEGKATPAQQPTPTVQTPTVPPKPIVRPISPLPKTPSRTREELESLIGGKLMNRVGALALVIGVGFFLKYAFDNNWITETMRVLIGVVIGLVCLAGGWRTKAKGLAMFSQGLVGAGIAILYLSLYASFNFYHLVPQWVAFLLMSAVTIIALVQAFVYDSLAVSILGWAGGFLTPFMLSTGQSNEIALFTYISLLSLGILAVTVRKESWFVLEPLTIAGTYIVYYAWYGEYHAVAPLTSTLFFIGVFWILFHVTDLVRTQIGFLKFQPLRHVVQSANALLAFSAVYAILYSPHRSSLGSAAFVFGSLYAITLIVLHQRGTAVRWLDARYALLTSAFLFLGTALQFKDITIVRLWPIEGLFLLWLGIRADWAHLRGISFVFFGGSLLLFFGLNGSLQFQPIGEFVLFLNKRAFSLAVIAVCLGTGALITQSTNASVASLRPLLGFLFFAVMFILLTAETNDFFRLRSSTLRTQLSGGALSEALSSSENIKQLSISGLWLVYSIVVMTIGILRGARGPRFFAIGVFGLSVLKIFIVDLSFLDTLYRIFSFIGLGLILLGVSYIYQKYKPLLFGPAQL
jgi:uncharacterized membrane protein